MYVTGGKPGGSVGYPGNPSHTRSIQQLMDIMTVYGQKDLTEGEAADQFVYRKMMVSAALGMNDETRLWTGGKNPKADPVVRYKIIKDLRNNAEKYHFQKKLFDGLKVENMRWIFENRLSDAEIPWLVNFTLEYPKKHHKTDGTEFTEADRMNGYNWTEYTENRWCGEPRVDARRAAGVRPLRSRAHRPADVLAAAAHYGR